MKFKGKYINVILPVYNAENTIERTLNSILAQTFKPCSIIVINDGSTDETTSILENYSTIATIEIINLPKNKGLLNALNIGLDRITSESIIFRIDADDIWLPNHIQSLLETFNNSDANFVASPSLKMIENVITGQSKFLTHEQLKRDLLWDNPLTHSAIAFDINLYKNIGGYSIDSYCLDYDLIIKLCHAGRFKMVSDPSVLYYVYENSLSRRIDFSIRIKDRFDCQIYAMKTFWRDFPLYSIKVLLLILFRKFLKV